MEKTKKELLAGEVVFKRIGKEILWLLIKSKKDGQWSFSKGCLKGVESSVAAAKREVKEKIGIETEILEKVDNENYFFYENKQKVTKTVIFYLMKYLEDIEDGFHQETKEIGWFPYLKAKKRLALEKEKEILKKAREILKQKERQLKLTR